MEHAATDTLSGDLGEEAFDQVEPRHRGRREMQVEPGMAFEPSLGLRCLVGGVVVDDQVESHLAPFCAALDSCEFLYHGNMSAKWVFRR